MCFIDHNIEFYSANYVPDNDQLLGENKIIPNFKKEFFFYNEMLEKLSHMVWIQFL